MRKKKISSLVVFMHNLVFRGLPGSNSGYGDATTYFALSFYEYNPDTLFVFNPSDHYTQKVKPIISTRHPEFLKMKEAKIEDIEDKIVFTIGTPKPAIKSAVNYNILYFYWETDTIPKRWIHLINEYDEIWAPCKLVKDAVEKCGFNKTVLIMPTPSFNRGVYSNFSIPHQKSASLKVSDKVFKFYYIFQWQYRKGYDALIKAYYNAFSGNDNVILIIKANKLEGSQSDFKKQVLEEINKIKGLRGNLPEIYVIPDFISNEEISYLHKMSDVYVAPNRGEGWGMPIVQAIMENSLIITTKFGGCSEFLDDRSALFIDYKKTGVKNMNWSGHLYTADQKWAEPDVGSLSKLMIDAYSKFENYESYTKNAFNIFKSFDINGVSDLIKKEFSSKRFRKWN